MARAFMISFLARQALTRSREQLAGLYPHPWLVWEPGAWTAPSPNNRMTILPPAPGTERPVAGDALCFELILKPGQTGLRVGRAPDCDIVINDATVSRAHLLLTTEGEGWVALVSPSSRGATTAGGVAFEPGGRFTLTRDMPLQIGEVQLTFHERDRFLTRVEAESRK
jgi:hypothetical protein